MNRNPNRITAYVLMAGLLALQMSPALAQFTQAGTQGTNWVVQVLTPVISLAVGVVGILCLTGRIPWGWFLGAVIGIGLFFGRDQIVSLVRGWTA